MLMTDGYATPARTRQLSYDLMLIKAKIKPNSKKIKIFFKDNSLQIYLTEPAENNRTNLELIRTIKKIFGSCKIIKGLHSRTKLLEIPTDLNTFKDKICSIRLRKRNC